MHGRLRVKTTEQQEAEKAIERQKKLAKYNAGTALLFKKRKERVYDEETALQLSQILAVNPDFYTLWNYRREIFLHWKAEKSSEYLQQMLKSDLQFTEQCLGVNPKSYCAWHHRCWVMENMPCPDWEAEIQLCDRYLKLDGRNFHCWDYRRFVVAGAGRSAADELASADRLIETNFSNYSSWHYRSHLLSQLFPASGTATPIREDKYLHELELVQNAAFTDPSDQAPWFYHRWLLQGRRPAASILSCSVLRGGQMARVAVALSRPARPADVGLTLETGESRVTEWASPTGESSGTVWVAAAPAGSTPTAVVMTSSESGAEQRLACNGPPPALPSGGAFGSDTSAAAGSLLNQELDNIWQLGEMEPDNKWVLLSSVVLMWALDPRQHHDKILEAVDELMKLDSLRRGYYRDLRSRFIIERKLESVRESGLIELDLSCCHLTAIYHTNHMVAMTTLDADNNQLRALDLRHLVATERVTAKANRVRRVSLPPGELCCLRRLALNDNDLREVSDLVGEDGPWPSVEELSVTGNPVCEVPGYEEQLKERFPGLKMLNGKAL
ncbi:geranylgeranyl transferase type-2 subunit alpha-like isoform X2 [Amphibalanus amphitrite]|uniref:geranylgeranyl transferase type-2 subunit alpha-like isoform X1 n=2 Tax=Amphibalanus amphitrite TaxID=1232801 RepID=UPI001C912A21|nr:geranylgeranyl transferase type-2 subunit alpha-like isoform X1 [Amphibalanus amphitrite]XP_043194811.1 geranylgeranyl transferase type-2 subunit alpha-like isoform X2 [Amphibalanus amphitrite]